MFIQVKIRIVWWSHYAPVVHCVVRYCEVHVGPVRVDVAVEDFEVCRSGGLAAQN